MVLLRGVNVGGHRALRPAAVARQLEHLGAVNIGAAGTFVIQQPITRAGLRAELSRWLPFECEITICRGSEVARLVSRDPFANERGGPQIVRFVRVLSRSPRSEPALPMRLPASGRWLVKLLARHERFVVGLYRRHMRVIGYLGALDRLFGVPGTTRNWSTILAITKALAERRV
ncbi:MAG TPA: DUF1697 domain-containing protein [Polyangiaceae bacterium]|nr:DUF1697 domain-containing protein [Polyangiaceae bacterium]